MASWQYKFLFPAPAHLLQPADAVHMLCRRNLSFDNIIRLAVATDDRGHYVDAGEVVHLTQPGLEDLRRRLRDREQFSIQCRNSELFVSVFFGMQSSNPHILLGWPRNLFCSLDSAAQGEYLEMVRDFAKASLAGYVVLLDDAADEFEDRFLEIDGVRHLDIEAAHQYGHGIQCVWINENVGGVRPEGAVVKKGNDKGDGFSEFIVEGR